MILLETITIIEGKCSISVEANPFLIFLFLLIPTLIIISSVAIGVNVGFNYFFWKKVKREKNRTD